MEREEHRPDPDTTPDEDDAPLAEDHEAGARPTVGPPEGDRDEGENA